MGLLCYALVTVAGVAITATGVGAPLAGYMGFSAVGPVAGSVAAGAQAYVGNVAAGSIFAGLQTLAMAPYPVHKVIELKRDEGYHAIRIKCKTTRCLRRNRIINPILYLPAFPRDRHRLVKWLPSYPLKTCRCGTIAANKEHYKNCSLFQPLLEDLNSAFGNLPTLHTELRPLEFIINRLPRSELGLSLGRWKKAKSALINVLREIDRLSHPKDDFAKDEPNPEDAIASSPLPPPLTQ